MRAPRRELRGRSEGAGPAPPGSLPAPPTVPWPQSRRCRPMNGVAFCLVGIPPRPEPRPPQVRRSAWGEGGSRHCRGSGGRARVAGPLLGWHSLGHTARAPRARLQGVSAGGGPGRGRSESCPGQEVGKEEGRQGDGTHEAARAGAQTRAAVPGPRRPASRGGRSAPFVRVFQAGLLPPFPLPEFSFSVGEAPAQLEGEGVGEGVPGAGRP